MPDRTGFRFRNRLFWKIGIVYLLLFLLVMSVLDIYFVRAVKREYSEAAFSQLEYISALALNNPPSASSRPVLAEWSGRLSKGGIRLTLLTMSGEVLADSEESPSGMGNHEERPEIRDAIASGTGRALRYSTTQKRELAYLARTVELNGRKIVMRFSLPLYRLDEGVADFRKRLWGISLLIVTLAGGITLAFFRSVSNRIGRLSEFSRMVAEGNFRPMSIDLNNDELAELAGTLNETALKLDQTISTLKQERNQSAAILASMEEGVAVIDTDRRVIFCNNAFREAAGIAPMKWEGRPVVELIRHSDLLSLIQKAATDNEVVHGDVVVGSVRTRSFDVTCAPVRSSSTPAGIVMVLHDITEIRRLERVRRDFVANVSHELRTPLTAIRGFAETLLEGGLDDDTNRRRFVEIIHQHALRLSRLTDDLLRLARIEAGKLSLEFTPVAVDDIVAACVETADVKARQKGLVLEVVPVSNLPLLTGDLPSLQSVLQELLDNAIRYSSEGGRITIAAAASESEVVISVSDTGIGIPKTDQYRIFERFYRTDPARSRESGGTGLGLSIAKHLVEAHGGRIRVESAVGAGSTFYIHLPVQGAHQLLNR